MLVTQKMLLPGNLPLDVIIAITTVEILQIIASFHVIHSLNVFLACFVSIKMLPAALLLVAYFTLVHLLNFGPFFSFLLFRSFRGDFFFQDFNFNRWRAFSLLIFGKTFSPVLFDMEPDLSLSPLNLADPARGCAPAFTVDEEEVAVFLADVLENQLLAGFQPDLLTELTTPVEKVGGQQDGGG